MPGFAEIIKRFGASPISLAPDEEDIRAVIGAMVSLVDQMLVFNSVR
jgi:hypothetical protein